MGSKAAETMAQVLSSSQKVHIKLLGDSITHGVGGTGFAQSGEPIIGEFARNPDGYCWANRFKQFMESRYNCQVVNNGCSGTKIEFILENLNTLVTKEDDVIICTIGTNNRHKYFKDGPRPEKEAYLLAFQNNIISLHEKIEQMGIPVIFVANIPAASQNELDGEEFWRILHMVDIRDAYLAAQKTCGFPLICMYDLFLQYACAKGIAFETLLSDGLHPNDAGFDVMFEILLKELGLEA